VRLLRYVLELRVENLLVEQQRLLNETFMSENSEAGKI
jgi:hypothetical protein